MPFSLDSMRMNISVPLRPEDKRRPDRACVSWHQTLSLGQRPACWGPRTSGAEGVRRGDEEGLHTAGQNSSMPGQGPRRAHSHGLHSPSSWGAGKPRPGPRGPRGREWRGPLSHCSQPHVRRTTCPTRGSFLTHNLLKVSIDPFCESDFPQNRGAGSPRNN